MATTKSSKAPTVHTSTYEDDDADNLAATMETVANLMGRGKKTQVDPRALAEKKKKTATRPRDEDEEEDGNDNEDLAAAPKKDAVMPRAQQYALMKAFHAAHLGNAQNLVKATYSKARETVIDVPAADFPDDMQDKCFRCEGEIRGYATSAYRMSSTNRWVHKSCCKCAATAVGEDGASQLCNGPVCRRTTGNKTIWCHVDRQGRPVCDRHIDTHFLDFPSFDVEKDPEAAAQFKASHGFVIVDTKMTEERNTAMCDTITNMVGALAGWKTSETREFIQDPCWDLRVRYPGIDHGEIGIVQSAKVNESATPEEKSALSRSFRADLLVSKEAWRLRKTLLPSAIPFFGESANIQSGITPMIIAPKGSATLGAVRCFTADARMTIRGDKDSNRKKSKEFLNGVYAFSDALDGQVSVLVCPEQWDVDDKTFTFKDEWFRCVPRAPDKACFPEDFPLKKCMLPIRLRAGQMVLFSDARPYSIDASADDNFFGSLVSWSSIDSKRVTTEHRTLMAIWSVVLVSQVSQVGYKFNKGMDHMIPLTRPDGKPTLPDHFSDIVTMMDHEDIPVFSDVLFGTKRASISDVPASYRGQERLLADPPAIDLIDNDDTPVVIEEERKLSARGAAAEEARRRSNAINLKRKMESEGESSPAPVVPSHVADRVVTASMKTKTKAAAAPAPAAPKPKPKTKAPAPKSEEEEDVEEIEEEQQQEQEPEEEEKPVQKAKRSRAKSARKKASADVYGSPVVPAEEDADPGDVPAVLRLNRDFITVNAEADQLADAFSTLLTGKTKNLYFQADEQNTESVIGVFDGTPVAVQLFDAFETYRLDDECEEALREFTRDITSDERAITTIGKASNPLGRTVRVYGRDCKLNNKNYMVHGETPAVLDRLMDAINETNGLEFDTIVALGMSKPSDSVNKTHNDGFVPGSPCVVLSIGNSGRAMRFRALADMAKADDTQIKKGSTLGDFLIPSGLGVAFRENSFDTEEGGISFELPSLPGSKNEDDSAGCAPQVVLIFGTAASVKRTARKGKAKTKSDAASIVSRVMKKPAPAPIGVANIDRQKRADDRFLQVAGDFVDAHAEALEANYEAESTAFVKLHTQVSRSRNPKDMAELRERFSALHVAIVGKDWIDPNASVVSAPVAAAPAAVAPKKKAPAAKPRAKPAPEPEDDGEEGADDDDNDDDGGMVHSDDNEENPDFMKTIPKETSKVVISNGKIVKRSTRSRAPPKDNKREIAKRDREPLLRAQYKRSESDRRRRGLSSRTYKEYLTVKGELEMSDDEQDDYDNDSEALVGSDSSGSFEEEEEEDVDEEEANCFALYNFVSERVSQAFDNYDHLIGEGSEHRELSTAYARAVAAERKCNGGHETDKDAVAYFERVYTDFSNKLEAFLKEHPEERVEKPHAARVSLSGDEEDAEAVQVNAELLARAGVTIQGWNPDADPEVSARFVRALVTSVADLARKAAFGIKVGSGFLREVSKFSRDFDVSEDSMRDMVKVLTKEAEQKPEDDAPVVAPRKPAQKKARQVEPVVEEEVVEEEAMELSDMEVEEPVSKPAKKKPAPAKKEEPVVAPAAKPAKKTVPPPKEKEEAPAAVAKPAKKAVPPPSEEVVDVVVESDKKVAPPSKSQAKKAPAKREKPEPEPEEEQEQEVVRPSPAKKQQQQLPKKAPAPPKEEEELNVEEEEAVVPAQTPKRNAQKKRVVEEVEVDEVAQPSPAKKAAPAPQKRHEEIIAMLNVEVGAQPMDEEDEEIVEEEQEAPGSMPTLPQEEIIEDNGEESDTGGSGEEAEAEAEANHPDPGAENSAEEATRDHRAALPPRSAPAPVPAVESLPPIDVVLPSPTAKTSGAFSGSGGLVAILKTTTGRIIIAAGDTEASIREIVVKRFEGDEKRADATMSRLELRKTPPNWMDILKTHGHPPTLPSLKRLKVPELFPEVNQ